MEPQVDCRTTVRASKRWPQPETANDFRIRLCRKARQVRHDRAKTNAEKISSDCSEPAMARMQKSAAATPSMIDRIRRTPLSAPPMCTSDRHAAI
jgi:hypothetical protein